MPPRNRCFGGMWGAGYIHGTGLSFSMKIGYILLDSVSIINTLSASTAFYHRILTKDASSHVFLTSPAHSKKLLKRMVAKLPVVSPRWFPTFCTFAINWGIRCETTDYRSCVYVVWATVRSVIQKLLQWHCALSCWRDWAICTNTSHNLRKRHGFL